MTYVRMSACFAIVCALLGASAALANPYGGNPLDWSPTTPGMQVMLQHSLIGSVGTAGNPLDVCSNQFPTSTQSAGSSWNTALSNWTLFRYQPSCYGTDGEVEILAIDYNQTCGEGSHACTVPVSPDTYNYNIGGANIYLSPYQSFSDGSSHTTRDIAHELGHLFGAGEDSYCPSGPTIMDSSESCVSSTPTSLDTQRYHTLYHADPVANVSATSPSANTVDLTWQRPYDVLNEKSYSISRETTANCTGGTMVKTVAKGSTSAHITGQPGGTYRYCVWSDTDADNQGHHDYGMSNSVTISSVALGRVSNFKIDVYASSKVTFSWDSLIYATGYKLCVSDQPSGGWICGNNLGNVTSTTTSVPSNQATYFFSVIGVGGDGSESQQHSNRGVLSRLTDSTYNSYFTAYKTSSGTKKVNGWNKVSSTRWLGFRAGTNYKSGQVSSNHYWYSSASSWTAADESTGYGPIIRPFSSTSSSLSPRLEGAMSTYCMTIVSGCN
jgi:hypothetical protein